MHTNDVSLFLCFCFHSHCRACCTCGRRQRWWLTRIQRHLYLRSPSNIKFWHPLDQALRGSRITSCIVTVTFCFMLSSIRWFKIDSSSFLILDSSSILIIRIWLRRLNRSDIVWICSIKKRTPHVSSSCRSALVRATTSSVSICLSFMSMHHRNCLNLLSAVLSKFSNRKTQ